MEPKPPTTPPAELPIPPLVSVEAVTSLYVSMGVTAPQHLAVAPAEPAAPPGVSVAQ